MKNDGDDNEKGKEKDYNEVRRAINNNSLTQIENKSMESQQYKTKNKLQQMNELYKLSENSAPQILGRNKTSKNTSEKSDENKS